MCTLKLFAILLVLLLVLGVLAFVFDSVKEKETDNPNYPTRAYRVAVGCSFIVKFGMILTACALVGSFASAGLGLAMAFAIPKPTKVQPSSWFDHSHNVATTIPFGAIVPVDWRFMLPGEKFKQNVSGFCRALMLKAPAMQDVDLKYATYFVPTRLLNDNNEAILSEVDASKINSSAVDSFADIIDVNGKTSNLYSYPFFHFNTDLLTEVSQCAKEFTVSNSQNKFDWQMFKALLDGDTTYGETAVVAAKFLNTLRVGSLFDYLGLPAITDSELASIGEFYSKYTSTVTTSRVNIKDIPISLLPFQAYHAICNHYFVPDFQRREVAASLVDIGTHLSGGYIYFRKAAIGRLFELRYSQYESDPYTCTKTAAQVTRIGDASSVGEDSLSALLNANTIRGMFALDEYARKIENFYGDLRKQIKFMFGIKVSDKSALSPILVDAGSCPIGVSEIQNTTLDSVDSEQSSQSLGKMTAGFGKEYSAFEVEEHGVMMTCVWIRPRTSYLNRIPPMFRFFNSQSSIPNPLFAEIGNTEVNAYDVDFNPFGWMALSGTAGYDSTDIINRENPLFGYNTRYIEWKYTCDSFTGDFRGPLAYWHCARDFSEDKVIVDTSQIPDPYITAGLGFNLINGKYSQGVQPLNRIFTQVSGIPDVRPFQLQLRFKTQIWQPYPHIDDEL